jgi:hypothetical protein
MKDTSIFVSSVDSLSGDVETYEQTVCVPDRLAEAYRRVGPQESEAGKPSLLVRFKDGRPCLEDTGDLDRPRTLREIREEESACRPLPN